jgi:hypothetical protein
VDAGAIIALAATLTVLLVAVNFSGRGTQLIGGLFSPPGLGWPPGVQEDDDLVWHWPDPSAAAGEDRDSAAGHTAAPPTRPQPPRSVRR